eukprot:CAMPEP_0197863266 /NCGR_PEP_ID=MMETSP1438-20131217/40586_1 /TAXON_ID=1461541 /ORGANISM="Pterosperma sp., Strain CCMP1384" /LENGTH=88 /DNA_ID=CAMNT_0043481091 /DNA_START=33 /DNA_END=295 /DNA_ORIENTATION=+
MIKNGEDSVKLKLPSLDTFDTSILTAMQDHLQSTSVTSQPPPQPSTSASAPPQNRLPPRPLPDRGAIHTYLSQALQAGVLQEAEVNRA